ncbi:MAG: hypothetical protein KF716_33565 [Anaerolineae bacterium]|nr:hypothetical protein [Anaerolineae bacterium]
MTRSTIVMAKQTDQLGKQKNARSFSSHMDAFTRHCLTSVNQKKPAPAPFATRLYYKGSNT